MAKVALDKLEELEAYLNELSQEDLAALISKTVINKDLVEGYAGLERVLSEFKPILITF